MDIKIKSVKAKGSSVNIGMDTDSAKILKVFLEMSMATSLIDDVAPVMLVDPSNVDELIDGIITGLNEVTGGDGL